ncbi:MAG TPA: FAD-binding oxidoreductase [Anaerolineae bacterium]
MADKSLDRAVTGRDDRRYDHKWGFTDTRFMVNSDRSVTVTGSRYALSGTEMPEFIPFVEEMLDIQLDLDDVKPECEDKPAPEPVINQAFCQALEQTFPATQYTRDKRQRLIHSHGQTTADEVYKVLYGRLERVADLVFYPESEDDAIRLITLAQEYDVCLVPYGGGTSVSCALKLPPNEQRMIVSVDMRRMNRIEWIDKENFRARVQAGITGKQLEAALEKEGFTSGHEPDSLELSTLGGWIATNASGMKKNRYGNIEDIVENVTMITPQGVVQQLVTMPRLSMGMRPQYLLFGSEGNLGLITKAVIKIHKLPQVKKYGSLVFPDFKAGVDYLYELTQAGALPASIRLLDNVQFRFGSALKPRPTTTEALVTGLQKFFLFRVKRFDPYQICAATIVMEGTAEEVAYQERQVYRNAKKYGGIAGGEGNGKRGYMLTYAIAYIRDFLSDYHIIGETYETTVPWGNVMEVCNAVAQKVQEQHGAYHLPGRPYISPRITQVYHTGVCIYFTHGFCTRGVEHPDEVFSAIERSLRQTILEAGGSISHHHGVGKLRKDFMPQTLSPASVTALREVKRAVDPYNVFGISNNVFGEE